MTKLGPSLADVTQRLAVAIVRESKRRHCSICGLRRAVYRVRLSSTVASDTTDARCASCWGIRE